MQKADFLTILWNNIQDTTALEWLGVLTSIAYVVLAAQSKRSCWYMAFVSSVCYCFLSFQAQLYVDSVLNSFYAIMAIAGWISWNKSGDLLRIAHKKLRFHALIISCALVGGGLLGWVLSQYTTQRFPYLESISFLLSISATWMITKKIIDNWLYFVVIDTVMVFIYFNRGYALTSVLFILYTLLAINGYLQWKKQLAPLNDATPFE